MRVYSKTDGRHGRFNYFTTDHYVGRSLAVYGEWSEAEVSLFRQIVRFGDTVIEAGANIGSHTIFLSQAVGLNGKLIAFEPARLTHQVLCANLVANECLNVTALQCAVGRSDGVVQFPYYDPRQQHNFGAAGLRDCTAERLSTTGATEAVNMWSIDSLGLDQLSFIKVDVEGYELELLEGARETLGRLSPVVYLEIDLGNDRPAGNRDELVEFVESFGYEAYYYFTPMFRADNFRGIGTDIFNAASFDILCVSPTNARVQGLTRARVGDTALKKTGNSVVYTALPWDGAQLTWI